MGIDEINIEADGFVTKEEDIKPLEKVTDNTAKPTSECCYPNCEKCRDYVSYEGANYCTVPMVINKQVWRLTADLIADMKREIDEVREMVYDVILDGKSRTETGNYSVEHDGFHKQVVGAEEMWCPDGYHIETYGGIDYYMANDIKMSEAQEKKP